MQVSEKLIRPLTEVKYLNADNVSRYRCIMRIFFENYEKLKYWLYQEEVLEEMRKDPFFRDYTPEQCTQDRGTQVNICVPFYIQIVTVQPRPFISCRIIQIS